MKRRGGDWRMVGSDYEEAERRGKGEEEKWKREKSVILNIVKYPFMVLSLKIMNITTHHMVILSAVAWRSWKDLCES